MEIIDELEPVKRGAYGGAVGWLSYARRAGHLHLHPHRRGQGRHRARAGRRRHRRRRQARLRVRGVARQGARRRAGDRAGGAAGGRGHDGSSMVDNYDSFTYNLVQYLGELGAELEVVRNDAADGRRAARAAATTAWSSRPGPCTPNEAGISVEVMRRFPEAGVPTLGVCLGHQSLAQAFGGTRRPPRAGARQDDRDHARRQGHVRRAAEPAARRRAITRWSSTRRPARLPGGDRPRRRRADGDAPPRAARASACSSIPSPCSRPTASDCCENFLA